MYKIVLIRHGESVWNKENRFTGWTDVDLSERGIKEAGQAGELLKSEGFTFDFAYTSVLTRAIKTLNIILDKMGLLWVPVEKSWRLNERHYGALQGLNKAETADKHGADQVKIWRRSYDIQPPALEINDKRHPAFDSRYSTIDIEAKDLPCSECLKDTVARFVPYWDQVICPAMKTGKKLIIAAHGNSLRALVKHLDNVSDSDILELNIPTGVPLVYEFDGAFQPTTHYYLGDQEAISAAAAAVANQGASK